MSDTLRKVPELSLLQYVNGSETDQADFVDKLFTGIKDYGFIILTDHTLSQEVIDNGYKAVKEFFAMDEEFKNSYISKSGGGQRGYTPFGTEHAKDSKYKDLKEFFHVGRQVAKDHKFYKYYPENIWPKIDGFKESLDNLYNELDKTSDYLLEALGKALDVPEHYFANMTETGNSILRAIHYPPVGEAPPIGSVRAAAHGDINLITILMGATASGLQLLDRDGTWLDVETKEGQLVVDAGDMMSRITNDIIPATIHRVINPEDHTTARYSMPFFVHPHPDAILECIPSCIGQGAKYPPISAHEELMKRLVEIGLKKS
ncbi:MAG: isopenicillin N synthase family oxygenase [Bacteriovoracaceae bacterium]|jgi:isopenicillin N synthase-like dioxygenase|nr:isopenicillin N synthase family oxygenase [Bacteriovoracaceae bacterium]